MRHGIIVWVLGIAGLLSIAAGVHQLSWRSSGRQTFERHVADLCVQAAQQTCARSCP
jgi:hypothetical protein